MYVETDFILALIKDEDWLGDAAEAVYREHRDDLWTSQFTLIELLMVAYREGRDTERVISNTTALLDVRGDVDTVVAAATYVEDHGFTPFDALHLVESDGDTIVSSDETYESFAPRLDLKETQDE
ncbi:PIN domain-containing protein [Haloferax sp. MBLA0076]|uniref:PIN domain-containing protein n=1 Tax=Haloferax litoreum TaxID=2666140 RepID=A0A6A8GKK8_9EURY|nr:MULTISPECIES: PIN domain-containing protein [Haloferax]KAB1189961.1 type II toxin-antitoxin system VapC family toxin [Haloferax sp. CBA1148]MRX23733.1 PIN domain-containing protein [Haloferax litoreum]